MKLLRAGFMNLLITKDYSVTGLWRYIVAQRLLTNYLLQDCQITVLCFSTWSPKLQIIVLSFSTD